MIKRSQSGMTLLEIMIVIMIIALLAMMAFPAMKKSREASQNTRFVADMRIAVNAFDQIAFESLGLPGDALPGVVPDRMADYLARMNWTEPTPIDGQWDWERDIAGFGNAVVVVLTAEQDSRMRDVDFRIDDGDLANGLFRKVGASSYGFLVE